MDKLKVRKLKKLQRQKAGWEKAANIISNKYRPNKTVDAIQALLKECGSSEVGFSDKKVDAETTEKLKSVGEKYAIDCQVHGKTISQYYDFSVKRMNQIVSECRALDEEADIHSKKVPIASLTALTVMLGVCIFAQYNSTIRKSDADLYPIQPEEQSTYSNNEGKTISEEKIGRNKERETKTNKGQASVSQSSSSDSKKKSSVRRTISDNKTIDYDSLPEYQLLKSEVDSYEDIYTLSNEIPCGLVNYNVSYDELVGLRDYTEQWDNILVYGDYSLYGYNHCNIWYYFNDNNILEKIEATSPYVEGEITFTSGDIEQIGEVIESELGVSPWIGNFEGTQYTFSKNDIQYHMDTYVSHFHGKSSNEFRLVITSEK